jgi:hypothetical protein
MAPVISKLSSQMTVEVTTVRLAQVNTLSARHIVREARVITAPPVAYLSNALERHDTQRVRRGLPGNA